MYWEEVDTNALLFDQVELCPLLINLKLPITLMTRGAVINWPRKFLLRVKY